MRPFLGISESPAPARIVGFATHSPPTNGATHVRNSQRHTRRAHNDAQPAGKRCYRGRRRRRSDRHYRRRIDADAIGPRRASDGRKATGAHSHSDGTARAGMSAKVSRALSRRIQRRGLPRDGTRVQVARAPPVAPRVWRRPPLRSRRGGPVRGGCPTSGSHRVAHESVVLIREDARFAMPSARLPGLGASRPGSTNGSLRSGTTPGASNAGSTL
jgi:hypothetical protein